MLKKVFYFVLSLFFPILIFGNESFIPDPPSLSSANYILIDSNTNRVLAKLNEDEKIELDVELSNISDKSNLIYSMPFHCSVGWKQY